MNNNDNDNDNNNNKRHRQESEPSSSSRRRKRLPCTTCRYFGNQCKEDCPFPKYLPAADQGSILSNMQKTPPEKHKLFLLAFLLCYKWIQQIPNKSTRNSFIESLMVDLTASNSTTLDDMNQVLHYNIQPPQPQLPNVQSSAQQPAPRGSNGMNGGQANSSPGRGSGMSPGQTNTNPGSSSGIFNFGPFGPPNTNPGCRNRSQAYTNNPGRGSSSGVNLGEASGSSGIINPGHQAITNPGVGSVSLPSYSLPADSLAAACTDLLAGIILAGAATSPAAYNNLVNWLRSVLPTDQFSQALPSLNQYYYQMQHLQIQQSQPMPRGIHIDNQANTSCNARLPIQQRQPMPRGIHTDQANTSSNPNVNPTSINNLIDEDELLLHPALSLAPHHEILQPTRSSSHSTQTSDSNFRIDHNEDIIGQAKDATQGPKP